MTRKLNNSSNIIMKAFIMGLWAVVIIGLPAASLCWSKNQGSDGAVFPLEVKDKPIREALNQLGQLLQSQLIHHCSIFPLINYTFL